MSTQTVAELNGLQCNLALTRRIPTIEELHGRNFEVVKNQLASLATGSTGCRLAQAGLRPDPAPGPHAALGEGTQCLPALLRPGYAEPARGQSSSGAFASRSTDRTQAIG